MIAICPNPYRDSGCELSLKIEALLQSEGFETCICPLFADEGDDIRRELLPQAHGREERRLVLGVEHAPGRGRYLHHGA